MLVKMELSNRRAKNVRTLFILSNNQVRNVGAHLSRNIPISSQRWHSTACLASDFGLTIKNDSKQPKRHQTLIQFPKFGLYPTL